MILAGPNGAGKSTVAPTLLHGTLAVDEFVNADVIARGLSAFDPESVAIAAGRVMLARLRELAARAEHLESQPLRVYDEGVWALIKRQGTA